MGGSQNSGTTGVAGITPGGGAAGAGTGANTATPMMARWAVADLRSYGGNCREFSPIAILARTSPWSMIRIQERGRAALAPGSG